MEFPRAEPAIRILVVDDHDATRRALKGFLSREDDFEVVAGAADGAQAVRLASSLEPDVVVMDVVLPGMSGVEATRRIRHSVPRATIIAVSLYDDSSFRTAMRDAGSLAFVTKEDVVERLPETIRRLVARARA